MKILRTAPRSGLGVVSLLSFGLLTLGLSTVLVAGRATAELVELRIDAIEPFAEGVAFGAAGPYQRMKGVARGELDPVDPRNAGIELLEDAPRKLTSSHASKVDQGKKTAVERSPSQDTAVKNNSASSLAR